MAFRAFTALHSGTTTSVNTITGTVPASCAAGDVLIITGQQGSGTNTLTCTTNGPTVPSLVSGPQITLANNDVWLWSLPLASGDLGKTVTITAGSGNGGYFVGTLHAFSGVQTTGLQVQVSSVSTATTSLTTPALTTTVANSEVINIYALRAASATTPVVTVPGSHTKDGAATTGAASASPSFSLTNSHRTTVGAAGSYGGLSATVNTASTGTLFTVALQPTSVSGTDTGFMAYRVDSGGASHRCDVFYVNASGTPVQVSSKTS